MILRNGGQNNHQKKKKFSTKSLQKQTIDYFPYNWMRDIIVTIQ